MTAPAEDPRGGEVWRVTTYVPPVAHRPPRPTSAEEVRHDHDPEVEGCNPATCPAYRARPAGDRAQPTQELREAIARTLFGLSNPDRYWEADWVDRSPIYAEADTLIAGPLAALLDAQAAVSRVEALAEEFDANINWREWGIGNRIRHALRGP